MSECEVLSGDAQESPAADVVLTATDPEPAVGALVRDDCGARWGNVGGYWVPLDTEGDGGDPESWTKIAGNYGPVTVVHEPEVRRG